MPLFPLSFNCRSRLLHSPSSLTRINIEQGTHFWTAIIINEGSKNGREEGGMWELFVSNILRKNNFHWLCFFSFHFLFKWSDLRRIALTSFEAKLEFSSKAMVMIHISFFPFLFFLIYGEKERNVLLLNGNEWSKLLEMK